MVVGGWRKRVVEEGVKEEDRIILVGFEEVAFEREGVVDK